MRRWQRQAILVGWIMALGGVMIAYNFGISMPFFQWMPLLPGQDKTAHLLAMGTLGGLMRWGIEPRRWTIGRWVIHPALAMALAVMTLEECSQIWIAHRTFEWADIACNSLGLIGASWAVGCLQQWRQRGRTDVAAAH